MAIVEMKFARRSAPPRRDAAITTSEGTRTMDAWCEYETMRVMGLRVPGWVEKNKLMSSVSRVQGVFVMAFPDGSFWVRVLRLV